GEEADQDRGRSALRAGDAHSRSSIDDLRRAGHVIAARWATLTRSAARRFVVTGDRAGLGRERIRWSRTDCLTLALLAAVVLGSLSFLVHPWYAPIPDASVYLSTARALLAGDGYSYLGEPFVVRPPGFSLLLAPVIAARGLDFAALNAFVALWGAAAVLLLFAHLRPRVGALLAAATALAVFLNPGFRAFSCQILSDVPGFALLLVCLLLEEWAWRRESAARDAVLGVAIGLACYVRAATLLLGPAVALSRIWRGSDRGWRALVPRVAVPAACATAVLLPWVWRDAAVAPRGAVEQTRLHSYVTAMWHEDAADPDSPRLGAREIAARV